MNTPTVGSSRLDISGLVQAIAQCQASDGMHCQFNAAQWEILASYMQPFALRAGQVLIEQGSTDRALYFVESGTLSVHAQLEKSRVQMALIGFGSVVGEGAFFSHQPRSASVQASGDCKLWCLTPIRFLELSKRHSPIALELTLAIAGVMARRMYILPKRIAVT